MLAKKRYRLLVPTLAIVPDTDRHTSQMIPAGAVITVVDGKPFDGDRLMDIEWNGIVVMMFTKDLKTSTEVLED